MQSRIINPKELIKKKPILGQIDLKLCVECKAVKGLCGLPRCPLIEALDLYPDRSERIETIDSDSVFGPVPQIFIGSQGYPRVNTGPMTSLFPDEETAKLASKPSEWVELELKQIIDLRFGMLRGKKNLFIKPNRRQDEIYDQLKELTLSVNPVDIESKYLGRPILEPKFDLETQPMGPSGNLLKLDITSNPKIPRKVERVIDDELKSSEQLNLLYQDHYDIYYLQNILSSGITGLRNDAKLVPTRWSITATDDIIGKQMINDLRDLPEIGEIKVLQGNLLGNYYTVILFPGIWSFEHFETWAPGGIFTIQSDKWSTTHDAEGFTVKEYYRGRTKYASAAGGYYASRLAVLEYLHQMKKQGRIVVIREISPDYVIPVGVWQVREGMRLTMKASPLTFSSRKELIHWLRGKFLRNTEFYLHKSITFTQRSLDEYF